jgi:polyhydroxyalkanoate synthesis regulator phasin
MSSLRCILASSLLIVGACTPGSGRMEATRVAAVEVSAPVGRTQQQARVIITRASLAVEVEEVAPAAERASRLAPQLGGFVENLTTREDKTAHLRLRIPAPRLQEALDSLGRLGKVTERSLSEDDVTAQSVDLEARVASFRAARDKLRELLDRAASVADAVAAQGELARVQAELDSLEAQLKTLQNSVALSELTLTLDRRVILGPLGIVGKALGTLIGKLFVWR